MAHFIHLDPVEMMSVSQRHEYGRLLARLLSRWGFHAAFGILQRPTGTEKGHEIEMKMEPWVYLRHGLIHPLSGVQSLGGAFSKRRCPSFLAYVAIFFL